MVIVESGSFIGAQEKLGLSAASISLHMTGLENQLDTVLCHRGRGGFKLTPEGERIFQACKDLMLAHDRFKSAVGEAKGKLVGELRLGIIDNSVFDHELNLPIILSKFRKIAPDVQISLYTMSPAELERAMLNQHLHLGIGVFYELSSNLRYKAFCKENMTLYCGDQHPLFKQGKSTIRTSILKSFNFVERTYGATLKRLNKPIKFNTTAYTSSLEATLLLILSGEYIGFLPRYYAEQWVNRNEIKPILPRQLFINTEVSLLTHPNPENTKTTQAIFELFLAERSK